MSRLLEHHVQLMLHFLPDGIAIGFYNHTSANSGLFGEVGANDELVVPFGVVLGAFYKVFCHFLYNVYNKLCRFSFHKTKCKNTIFF